MKSIIFLIALSLGYYARASNADKFMYKGLELYSTYFIASSLPVSFEYGGNSFDATFSDLSFSKLYLPAIGIKYDWIRNDGFGLNFGLRYEFDRSLEKVSAKFDGQNVGVGGRGFFSFFLFEPNVTCSISPI